MNEITYYHLRKIANHEREVHQALATGQLKKVAPNIAIDSTAWETAPLHTRLRIRAQAAGLSTTNAVLVGKSAARLHNLWVISSRDELVELQLPSGANPPKSGVSKNWHYRRGVLRGADIEIRNGVRVVSAARACVDIARFWGFKDGVVAMDSALAMGVTREGLMAALTSLGRIKGAATVRACIEAASPFSESAFESWSRALLIEAKLPGIRTLEPQFLLPNSYRADLGINGWLLFEVDGDVKYDGRTYGKPTDEVLRRERQRERELINLGFQFLRYSPRQLLQNPERVLHDVAFRLSNPPREMPQFALRSDALV